MLISRGSQIPRRKIVLFVGDAFCTAVAIHTAVFLRLGFLQGYDYLHDHQIAILLCWLTFLVTFYVGGLYESERLSNLGRTLASAVGSVVLGSLLVTAVFYAVLMEERIGRGIFFGGAAFILVGVTGVRMLYIAATRRGFMGQRCLIIGSTEEARHVVELVQRHPHAGLKILGIIQCNGNNELSIGKFIAEYPVLGTIDALGKFVELYGIDRLILAASIDFEPVLLRRLRTFRYRGTALVDFVTLYEELAQEIPLDHINDEWLFLASMNNSRFHIRRLKRLVDMMSALFGLLLTAPLTALAAVLVKLTSRGPVLYRQERLGRDSVPFLLYKFRTMRQDAESQSGPVWALQDDPRITPVGKWLRKFRIDEIPQLWNVLQGDMSLVGPRPERAVFIKKLNEKVPFYAERLLVPPGVTGWAQVMHPYAASIEESRRKLQFDLYYIKHMSFLLDTYIMFKTVNTILFGRERSDQPHPAATPQEALVKTEMLYFPAATSADAAQSPSSQSASGAH